MSYVTAAASTPLRSDAGVIGLVGLAHLISHFSQLLLPPLFPWLKDAFGVSYTQLGFLMTIFFVVSFAVQTAAGFLVDRFGPRPVLFGGLALDGPPAVPGGVAGAAGDAAAADRQRAAGAARTPHAPGRRVSPAGCAARNPPCEGSACR